MAKQTGLGDNLYVGGVDVSGDIGSLGNIGGGNSPLEVTGIDKSGMERLGGKRDGQVEFTAFFNPSAGQAHPTLSPLPTTDVVLSYFRGTTLGNPVANLVGKQINYDPTRGEDGSLTFKVDAQANAFGLEWGVSLTAGKRTDTGATNGAGVDTLAALNFGAQAYLHVFSFTGTDVTVKVQDSADNISFADLTGGVFTQITGGAPLTQRIATSSVQTVRQYLRVATVTTGGFSNLVFAVSIAKNPVAVTF